MRTMENHNEDEGGKEAEEEFNAKKIKTIERSFNMETLLYTSSLCPEIKLGDDNASRE